MKRFIRWFGGAVSAIALALSLAAGGAAPALAAGITRYIDDGVVANGTTACPSPEITTDLSSVTVVSNTTLYLCPGVYTGALSLTAASNVKVIGRGSPVIRPGASAFLVRATDSTNVTIQGLILDGYLSFADGFSYGIWFTNSTGTITNNVVVRVRETTLTSNCYGFGIQVDNAPGPVKILKNTVTDAGCRGIGLMNSPMATIQRNVVWMRAVSGSVGAAISVFASPGVTISTNNLSSSHSYRLTTAIRGIYISDTPNAKLAVNTISTVNTGIEMVSVCNPTLQGLDNASVTGNTITDSGRAIMIDVEATSGSLCNPTANNITLKGNKLFSTLPLGYEAILVFTDDTSGTYDPQVQGLKMSSNQYSGYFGFYQPIGPNIQTPPALDSKNTKVMPPLGSK